MKRVSCIFRGGLGNQLFILAAGLKYAEEHNLPFVLHKNYNQHEIGQGRKIQFYYDTLLKNIPKENITLPPNKDKRDMIDNIYEYHDTMFLDGYFQNEEKYFPNYREKMNAVLNISDDMKSHGFIHIRGGDYHRSCPSAIIPKEYYDKAFHIMNGINSSIEWKIYTDDTTFAKKLLGENYQIVSNKNELDDFYEMIECEYTICSHSSFCWWTSYLGNSMKKVVSPFGNRNIPRINKIMDISSLKPQEEPTELCNIMSKYGSDKGNYHNYTRTYYEIFKSKRYDPLNIFEVGLGTNNTDVPSNMGIHGKPGASLRGWKEFFPNALVYGADVDKRILFQEERIKTYFCDQLNSQTMQDMWNQIEVEGFDIILDDGLHTLEANKNFLDNSLHKLKSDGIFIIEDVSGYSLQEYKNFLNEISNINYHIFELVKNPPNDNNFIAIWR